jgi:mannitol/fructose-specific phosphotransferase system IIA component (Ntr-type)
LGTSALLERKLSIFYPQVTVTKKYSYKELKSLTVLDADLLLTTIDLPFSLSIPVVYVSPLLQKEDQKRLIPYIGESRTAIQEEGKLLQVVKDVLTVVKNNSTVHNESNLMTDLLSYFQGQDVQKEKKRLTDFLPLDAIRLQVNMSDWRSAIKLGNDLLINSGCTNKAFSQSLIHMAEQPGNHFVIGNGIAFPHASSDRNVYKTGFSLITLKQPLAFGSSEKEVWFVLTLAAVDQQQHTYALATLLDALNDEEFMYFIRQTTDVNEVWHRFLLKEGEVE